MLQVGMLQSPGAAIVPCLSQHQGHRNFRRYYLPLCSCLHSDPVDTRYPTGGPTCRHNRHWNPSFIPIGSMTLGSVPNIA